jgi:hypothetical protein
MPNNFPKTSLMFFALVVVCVQVAPESGAVFSR